MVKSITTFCTQTPVWMLELAGGAVCSVPLLFHFLSLDLEATDVIQLFIFFKNVL